MLIAPADEWQTPAFSWDPTAQNIHGLSLQTLQINGLPASQVCQTLNRHLQDRVVIFDTGPDGVDRHWMDILFSEASDTRLFRLGGPAGDLLKAIADDHRVPPAVQASIKAIAPPITHRAADDAAHYAWRAAAIVLASELSGPVSPASFKIELRGKRRI